MSKRKGAQPPTSGLDEKYLAILDEDFSELYALIEQAPDEEIEARCWKIIRGVEGKLLRVDPRRGREGKSKWEHQWEHNRASGGEGYLATAWFGDVNHDHVRRLCYVAFFEMIRWLKWEGGPSGRRDQKEGLRGAIRDYLEERGYIVPVKSETPASVALTDEDRYILFILDKNRGKALTNRQIEDESIRLNREDTQKMRRLSERMIQDRVPVLEEQRLVVRPPGTKRKGVTITDAGRKALHFAAGNPPESRR